MATHFAQVLFFRSFYVCFPSGHYFTLVSIFAKDGQQYICARRLSIAAVFAKFRISPVIIADWRCPLTGPTCCTSIDSFLIDFDILLDRRFINIDAYQVFSLVRLGRLRNVSRSVAWSGLTIDGARPSFVNHIVVDGENQDHHHRDQDHHHHDVARGGRRVVSVSGLPSTSRRLINSIDRSPMTRSS